MLTSCPPQQHTLCAGDRVEASGFLVEPKLNGAAGVVLGERGPRLLVDFEGHGRRIVQPRHLKVVTAAKDRPPTDLRELLSEQRNELRGREDAFAEYRDVTFGISDRVRPAEPQRRRGDFAGDEDRGALPAPLSFTHGCCVFADPNSPGGGITPEDVLQKRLQDSYFLAVLAGAAAKPIGQRYLRSIVRLSPKVVVDSGGPVVEVRFLRSDVGARRKGDRQLAEWVPITALLPAHRSRRKDDELVPLYAKSKMRDLQGRRVIWPSLMEKAWVVYQESMFPSHYGCGDYGFVDAVPPGGAANEALRAPGDGVHTTMLSCRSVLGSIGELYVRERDRIHIDWEALARAVERPDCVVLAQYELHVVPVVAAYMSNKTTRIVRVRDQAAPASERYSEYDHDGFITAFDSVRVVRIPEADEIPTIDFISPHGSPRRDPPPDS